MSSHPSAGQGRVRSASQMPDKSGFPSAVRGVGAFMSGLPSRVLGTPAVGYVTHCAYREAGSTRRDVTSANVRVAFDVIVAIVSPRAVNLEPLSLGLSPEVYQWDVHPSRSSSARFSAASASAKARFGHRRE